MLLLLRLLVGMVTERIKLRTARLRQPVHLACRHRRRQLWRTSVSSSSYDPVCPTRAPDQGDTRSCATTVLSLAVSLPANCDGAFNDQDLRQSRPQCHRPQQPHGKSCCDRACVAQGCRRGDEAAMRRRRRRSIRRQGRKAARRRWRFRQIEPGLVPARSSQHCT